MLAVPPNSVDLPPLVAEAAKAAFSGPGLTEALRGTLDRPGRFRSATDVVKKIFCDLGHSFGFKVAASGCAGTEGGEWLYDMCWFTDNTEILRRMALVLETEMKPGGNAANAIYVDTDFQKLVQAKADVRVWFCAIPNEDMVRLHIAACKKQISGFEGSNPSDRYILVLYEWRRGLTSVETIGF